MEEILVDFARFLLLIFCFFVFLYILVSRVKYFHNLTGDFFGKDRCYGCGESYFLRKLYTIYPVNFGGMSVSVCDKCGHDQERIKISDMRSRLLGAGFNKNVVCAVLFSVRSFKEQRKNYKRI